MYVIREIARKFGLSRATLLYYDRIGLLKPAAISDSGYRLYDEKCAERLNLICTYKNAGLSLKEVKTLLDTPESQDGALLQNRILEIDREIARLKTQQRLLIAILKKSGKEAPPDIDKKVWVEMFEAAGLSEEEMQRWHVEFESRAPDSHHAFLQWLGIPEREVVEIRHLSRSIQENPNMMKYFNEIFHALPRQGPGCDEATRQAWRTIRPFLPEKPEILDIGCGSGASTLCLARLDTERLVGLDNDEKLLQRLSDEARAYELGSKIETVEASMYQIPFEDASFDVIWAEGSLYIIGFEKGLKEWKRLLRRDGVIAVTELCWITDNPPAPLCEYWAEAYPAMTTVSKSLDLAEKAGYEVIDHFTLPKKAWTSCYYKPMEEKISELRRKYPREEGADEVCRTLEKEIRIYEEYNDFFGYVFFFLRKRNQ